jgi:DNA-binding NarL/FixJ family response regulator
MGEGNDETNPRAVRGSRLPVAERSGATRLKSDLWPEASPPAGTITVVLAAREWVRWALFQARSDFAVVAETTDASALPGLLQKHEPDVLLIDTALAGAGGLELGRGAARLSPRTRVFVLSLQPDDGFLLEVLPGGASGHAIKAHTGDELVAVVSRALRALFAERPIAPRGRVSERRKRARE